MQSEPFSLVTYDEQYAGAFGRLNRLWLERHELFEEGDRKYLEHPKETIIDHGGEIFFALQSGEVVGTCATLPHSADAVEIVKLTVADHAVHRDDSNGGFLCVGLFFPESLERQIDGRRNLRARLQNLRDKKARLL